MVYLGSVMLFLLISVSVFPDTAFAKEYRVSSATDVDVIERLLMSGHVGPLWMSCGKQK